MNAFHNCRKILREVATPITDALFRLLLAIAAVCLASEVLAAEKSVPVMAIPGQSSVTPSGAAVYTIPLSVPPGTGGMAPGLSLQYSSQNGDGTVGESWSLAGLPTITRCARTLADDGIHGGVNFNSSDRFCMNGQRLVAISGTYGADGTIYRTQIENFSKIISHGTAGSGPQWFEFHTLIGQTIQLGNSADSRLLAQGTATVQVWAVNKISDTKGNYLTVTYTNDTVNGQAYPIEIDYTGNQTAALAPYNSVKLTYVSRPDIVPTYEAGSLIKTTVLLSEIKTYNGTNVVTDYKLAYRLGSTTLRSRLTGITQCDGTGATCLPATTFGWQGGIGLPAIVKSPETIIAQVAGDFNGDGLTDVYGINIATGDPISLGTLSNTFSSATFTIPGSLSSLPIQDLDGDGYSDIVLVRQFLTSNYFDIYQNNRMNVFDERTALTSGSTASSQFGDFNGDGRGDYAYLTRPFFGGGAGTFTAGPLIDPGMLPATVIGTMGDFDGDGCSDYLTQGGTSKIYYLCSPSVASYVVPNWYGMSATTSLLQLIPADFNGDGKADMLASVSSGTSSPPCPFGAMYLSTGTSLTTTSFSVPNDWCKYTILAGDFNGDGRADLALIADGAIGHYGVGHDHKIYLSTGTGFVLATTIPGPTTGHTVLASLASDWNSDGAEDLWINQQDNARYLFQYVPELMTSVNNGIGSTTTITYDRINKNGSLYTKGTAATYPDEDQDAPIYVVSKVDQQSSGGTHSTTYAYGGARLNWTGRGFLGFAKFSATDLSTGIVDTTNYDQIFPLLGQVDSEVVTAPKTGGGTVAIKTTTNTFDQVSLGTSTDGVARYFVAMKQSVIARNDEDFVTGTVYALPSETDTYTYDCDTGGVCGGASPTGFGNVLTQKKAMSDGSFVLTTNTYTNDIPNWLLGRPLTSNAESKVGTSDITRHFAYTYEAGTGLVATETLESGASDPSLTKQTKYTYDAFGNRIKLEVIGCVWTSSTVCTSKTHTTDFEFDTPTYHGAFLTKATQHVTPVNHVNSFAYNPYFGTPTSHTDPNSLITLWSYDTFGRETLETRPDGNKTATSYTYCTGLPSGEACPTGGQADAIATPQNSSATPAQNGPISIVFFDSLLRQLSTDTQGLNAGWIRAAQQYDASGRVVQTSRPYFLSGGTAKWTVNTFDPLGRANKITFPDMSETTTSFQGLKTVVTNNLNQTFMTLKNAQNLAASTTDSLSNVTTFVYDGFGNALTITDAATPTHHVITNTYDLRGRRKSTSDPDMGTWSYVYDSYDELYSQTDAKAQTSTLTYDELGRALTRTEPGLSSTWVYDTAAHGVGKLTSSSAGASFSRAQTYDTQSRPAISTTTIDSSSYIYTTAYDSNGRLDTTAYPSGFVARNVYTTLGYLSQIEDNGGSGQVFWTVSARDAELHLTSLRAGNNVIDNQVFDPNTGLIQTIQAGPSAGPTSIANFTYTFDTIGNLTKRIDGTGGFTEWFCYDSLNRLHNYALGASCTASGTKTVAYDVLGNITSKSDAGTYNYSGVGAGPHAVTSITGTVNGVLNPTYTYDANGNETCVYPAASTCALGATRAVAWTSFNMVSQITQNATIVAISYDADHARYKQCILASCAISSTLYLTDPGSGTFSEKYTAGAAITWKDYFQIDGKIVGVRSTASGVVTPNYYILDSLGSVSEITGSTGAVITNGRLSYDAWGKMRQPNGTDDLTCSLPATNPSTRGYTNQEQIASGCVVNLNARIYDPSVGKFFSADDVIPHPEVGQSYNRYAYVDNRPLSSSDVTGHMGDPSQPFSDERRHDQGSQPNAVCLVGVCDHSGLGNDIVAQIRNSLRGAVQAKLGSEGKAPSGLKVTVTASVGGYNISVTATYSVGSDGAAKVDTASVKTAIDSVLNDFAGAMQAKNGDLGSSKFTSISGADAAGQSGSGVRTAAADENRLTPETESESRDEDAKYDEWLATHRRDKGPLPTGTSYLSDPNTPKGPGGVPLTGSGLGNTNGGAATPPDALNGGEEYLGSNYKEIAPGVYRSSDGTRQFRMTGSDLLGSHGDIGPHVHFESIGPDGRVIEENTHVKLKQ